MFIMPCFENIRLDIQFRLSEKPEFIDNTLPARANQLARRLASILGPLFFTRNNVGQRKLLSKQQEPCCISENWITRLEAVFLDALKMLVKFRQKEAVTEFFWPKIGAVFSKKWMQAENNATKDELEGNEVLITLVPAAFSRVPIDDNSEEMEDRIHYQAAVVLDMEGL